MPDETAPAPFESSLEGAPDGDSSEPARFLAEHGEWPGVLIQEL